MISSFVAVMIKMFFLLTPFFALSMFLTYTADYTKDHKRKTAIKTTIAVIVITQLIYWFGEYLFMVLGITIDAFRIGAGTVLLLTAIALVNGPSSSNNGGKKVTDETVDLTVVPLAIPTIVGPGTIGALLVMGADGGEIKLRLIVALGIITAVILLGSVLLAAEQLERLLKRNGIQILSKVTGLMLAALSAQIIFDGIKNILE